MRALFAVLCLAFISGCASLAPRPAPLSEADLVQLAREGETPEAIIARLDASQTVLPLSASDIVRLHGQGVPAQVLDWLQQAQLEEIRRREAFARSYRYDPFGRSFGCTGLWSPYPYQRWQGGWLPC
jgi:hypothetical protein